MTTLCLAAEGFSDELERELQFLGAEIVRREGDLFLVEGEVSPAWTSVVGFDAEILPMKSIGEGAKLLRSRGRDWVLIPGTHHRRAALVAGKVSSPRDSTVNFPERPSRRPYGVFTLLAEDQLLLAPRTDRLEPCGRVDFMENKEAPSRAYLKLWEALTVTGKWPAPGDRCVDLGSCPGGWTWVLARLGAQVTSVDGAPLDPRVARMPGVEFRKGDAFAIQPQEFGKVDWLFSDVICYPEKLLGLVEAWSDWAEHMVVTIKFQGPCDFAVLERFLKIPGSSVRHLWHNKHELTFFRV